MELANFADADLRGSFSACDDPGEFAWSLSNAMVDQVNSDQS